MKQANFRQTVKSEGVLEERALPSLVKSFSRLYHGRQIGESIEKKAMTYEL